MSGGKASLHFRQSDTRHDLMTSKCNSDKSQSYDPSKKSTRAPTKGFVRKNNHRPFYSAETNGNSSENNFNQYLSWRTRENSQSDYSRGRKHQETREYEPDRFHRQHSKNSSSPSQRSRQSLSSLKIILTEIDHHDFNPYVVHECLQIDEELEHYLNLVYQASEAILDVNARRVALHAEKAKQLATEQWLLSRTPEERVRYLQNRPIPPQL
jgi:hypothetical protein